MWNIEKIVKKGDYLYAVVKNHPNSIDYGYVLLHRIIMENHLGRLLDKNEVVHHKNGNRKDNNIENLELMNARDHVTKHMKERGHLCLEMKCPGCGKIFVKHKRQTHVQKGGTYTCCSRECKYKFSKLNNMAYTTTEEKLAISGNIIREFREFLDSTDNPEQT